MSRVERVPSPGRILEMSRDPLFKAVYPDDTVWVQTGRPLEPFGRHAGHADYERSGVATALAMLAARRFDFVAFPAMRLKVPGDAHNRMKARLRRLLSVMARATFSAKAGEVVFGLGGVPYIIRDVGDFPDLDEAGTRLLPRARLYSKREVLEGDLATSRPGFPPIVYTPMPFEPAPYEAIGDIAKETDVFYAARPFGDLRRQAGEVVERLRAEGVSVDVPAGRVDFDEYLRRMAQARLVVSPRGQGEHCYRHYEALLVGSVPVINRPLRPVHYDLVDGYSCLFYEPTSEGLAATIVSGLSDRARLDEIAAHGRDLVQARHDKTVICGHLLEQAGVA